MRRILRDSSAAAALALVLAAAAPASAQSTSAQSNSAEEIVGPPQLRDFTLNGTVTREAQPPPEQPAPRRAPIATPVPAPGRTSAPPATAEQPARQLRSESAPRLPSAAERRPAEGRGAFELAAPTPAPLSPVAVEPAPAEAQPASSAAPDGFVEAGPESDGGFWSVAPWLLALLAAAAAAWYFRRQRSGYAFAGAGHSNFDLTPPAPAPDVRPRAPAPAASPAPAPAPRPPAAPAADPPAAAPVGIVSTRLRPWLEIEFAPERAVIEEGRATIHFDIALFNSGSAPARDVHVEALLFNAGPDQDEAIAAFFSRPTAQGEPIPAIPPLQRLNFRSAVSVSRDQMRIFEAGGRQLFVPLIGFNAIYRWSGGEGQTSVSYLLGRDTDGEKMAPLRVDLGARTFRGLGARAHALGVRR